MRPGTCSACGPRTIPDAAYPGSPTFWSTFCPYRSPCPGRSRSMPGRSLPSRHRQRQLVRCTGKGRKRNVPRWLAHVGPACLPGPTAAPARVFPTFPGPTRGLVEGMVCLVRGMAGPGNGPGWWRPLEEALAGVPGSGGSAGQGRTPIGRHRAGDMVVNCVLPFLHALGQVEGDAGLSERAVEVYHAFPKLQENEITREMRRLLCPNHPVGYTGTRSRPREYGQSGEPHALDAAYPEAVAQGGPTGAGAVGRAPHGGVQAPRSANERDGGGWGRGLATPGGSRG